MTNRMLWVIVWVLCTLMVLVGSVGAQTQVTNTAPADAVPVRCVNTAGTMFEACGGGGAGAVDQGANNGSVMDSAAWSVRLIFGNAHIDPRLVTVQNDLVSEAVAVRCVNAAGAAFVECGIGGAGTTDTDDGSIAGGQSVGLNAALANIWNGAAWVRLTLGQTTKANSVPVAWATDLDPLDVSGSIVVAVGDAGHDTPDAGTNPVKVGCKAVSGIPADVTAGDRVDTWCGLKGQVMVQEYPSFLDSSAFTFGTTPVSNPGYVVDDIATNTVAENSAGAPRMSPDRVPYAQGAVAHDALDSGNPIKIGGFASVNPPAGVGDGDRVNAWFGTAGQQAIQLVAGSGGTGDIDKTDLSLGFSQAGSKVLPIGFIYDDTAGTLPTENQIAAARITAARAQVMRIEGATRGTYATLTGTSQDMNCTGGCVPTPSNIVTLNIPSESVAAPTAAVWYQKRRWAIPAAGHYVPIRVWSYVTTAASETMIVGANRLGSFNVSTNAFTDGNSVASPRFYSRILGCVTTVMSAVATAITVTYTDELGNTGNLTGAVTFAASSPVGNCYEFVNAVTTGEMRDNGVRDITAVSDTAAPTGVVELFGINEMFYSQHPVGFLLATPHAGEAVGEFANPEEIMILFKQAAVTAQIRFAGIEGAVR